MTKLTIAERQPLTQERLKEIFHYDPETGIFTWRVKPVNSVKIGAVAGHVDKNDGYARIKVNNILYKSHRVAWLYMTGAWPKEQIDHRNRIRNDNRFGNLREATSAMNGQNISPRKGRKAPMGVTRHGQNWRARIMLKGKSIALGTFSCIGKAVQAHTEAKHKLHPFSEASP